MPVIIDISILLIIGLCIFFGYRKGLIGVAFKIISFVVALVIAVTLSYPISNMIIENTDIDENITSAMQSKFVSQGGLKDENQGVEIKNQEDISNVVLKFMDESINDAKTQGVKVIAENLSIMIIRVSVGIGLYVLTKIALFFFRKLSEVIAEIPIIKQFNKAGGFLYGVLKGFLLVYTILAVASLLAPAINNTELFAAINESTIGAFMYNNNLLLQFIL